MTKTEMIKLVRSMGANENTITAMENAYEMGVEAERNRITSIIRSDRYGIGSSMSMWTNEHVVEDINNGDTP